MQEFDIEKVDVVAAATEFSEQCELVCFAPMGETASDWGNELVAGAVHGSELLCNLLHLASIGNFCAHILETASQAT